MGRSDIRAAFHAFGVGLLALGLLACVESARSADVPPELAPPAPKRLVSSKAKQLARGEDPAQDADAGSSTDAGSSRLSDAAARDATSPADTASDGAFFGVPDEPIREALRTKNPVTIEKGRGGRSLGFRITLEGGQKGYFKGEQVFSAANWFGEVAAYHLDRILKLERVPAVVSRQFPWAQLEPAAGSDWRKPEMIVRNGMLKGAFVAWVDGGVRPLTHKEGWERWMRVKYWPTTAVTPFQRPAVWAQEHAQVRRLGVHWRSPQERARLRMLRPEPDRDDRPAELSDLIVFDYLIKNLDRWGGGNANVLMRGEKGPLIFLDNAAGFEGGDPRPSLIESRLRALQRFRRSTITAIRSFDLKKFEARLATEPVQPVLSRVQLDGLEVRRKALLAWVAEMEGMHGEAIWAWE
jgi:hypothetical protein